MCAWLLLWVLLGLDWVLPIMLLNCHVTCSCTFHAYVLLFFSFYGLRLCFSSVFSPSLSLSRIEPLYGTQIEKIHSSSKPSSRFQVILFISSFYFISHPIPWWEGQDRLLWDLMPSHFVRFLQHYATQCHSNSRMGISTWETRALSCHVYTGVLLQHTRHRYLCASVCYAILRYTYSSYPGSCCRVTMSP